MDYKIILTLKSGKVVELTREEVIELTEELYKNQNCGGCPPGQWLYDAYPKYWDGAPKVTCRG